MRKEAEAHVVAIKTAGFDRYLTLDVVRAVTFSSRKDKIALYTGNDDNIINDLITPFSFQKDGKTYENHFVGGLLGHWAVWTNTVVKIFAELKKAVAENTVDASWLTLAAQITDANSAFFDTANDFKGCIAGVHEVLRRQGLMEGIWCLNPEDTLSIRRRSFLPDGALWISASLLQYPPFQNEVQRVFQKSSCKTTLTFLPCAIIMKYIGCSI